MARRNSISTTVTDAAFAVLLAARGREPYPDDSDVLSAALIEFGRLSADAQDKHIVAVRASKTLARAKKRRNHHRQ